MGATREVHVSSDKSPAQVKGNILAEQITRALSNASPETNFHINRATREVSTQQKLLVRGTPKQSDDVLANRMRRRQPRPFPI
eukprot:2590222-Pyramimonas_sp.AAC.1